MSTRHRRNSIVQLLFLPCLTILVLSYFAFHAVNGRYGFRALERDTAAIEELKSARDELIADKAHLKSRVNLLTLSAIDPDLLDERARQLLGYVRPDELVVYFD